MGCGCGNKGTTVWVYTPPGGQPVTYSKEIQAKVAQIKAGGGGTIEPKQK
jgi:hypothetical protein